MSAPPRPAPPAPTPLRAPRNVGEYAPPSGLQPYVAAIRAKLALVVALPLVFGLIAALLSMSRPRAYEARAAFIASEPQSMSGSLGALSSVASQLGVPGLSAIASSSATGSAQFYGDLLSSRAITHKIVTDSYDASAPGEFGGVPFKGTLVDYFDPWGKTPGDKEVAAMRLFSRGMVRVGVDRPTGIVRITVKTKNRDLSALLARRLLDQVNEFNLLRRQTQAGAERDFALKRAQAAADTLRVAEAVLAEFRATNIDFSRSPRLATREAELQRRVSIAQQTYTTVTQRYEQANIEAVRNTPVVTVIDAPEGLVEAQSRNTATIMVVAAALGFALAVVIALYTQRAAIAR